MVDVFVPHGYASKTFWATQEYKKILPKRAVTKENNLVEIQPFAVYQLDQPHVIRKRHGHLGASPRCRASATESMDLVRKVLQPAINKDVIDVLEKYIMVFRDAAENVSINMQVKPFAGLASQAELDVDAMTYKCCCDALEHCKSLFDRSRTRSTKAETAAKQQSTSTNSKQQQHVASSLPARLHMKRLPSPDFPWSKRLSKSSPRRSLSPTPAKRRRPPTRTGSPHASKELRRDHWDPDKLTIETRFVMGTRANKALGLGATRGRIYMKHPDLFKYSSDPEDKKWMIKNNCMLATGGKNTFIMIADNIFDLLENEYKDSPHLMPEEMQVFTLPEFILQKMRALMIKEKKAAQKMMNKADSTVTTASKPEPVQHRLPAGGKVGMKVQKPPPEYNSHQHPKRHAAERAAAAITASSEEEFDEAIRRQPINTLAAGEGNVSSDSARELISDEEDVAGRLLR